MEQLITKELIILDLESSSKKAVITDMAKLIAAQERLINFDGYVAQVFEREKTFPTSVGFGVAIPHGKTDAVKIPALAFARLKQDVRWSDNEEVKYVFLIAVPEKEASEMHLQILAQLSRKIMREDFREKLKNLAKVEEILDVLLCGA